MQQASYLHMRVPFYRISWNNAQYGQANFNMQAPSLQQVQQGPLHSKPILQVNPPVMPELRNFVWGAHNEF